MFTVLTVEKVRTKGGISRLLDHNNRCENFVKKGLEEKFTKDGKPIFSKNTLGIDFSESDKNFYLCSKEESLKRLDDNLSSITNKNVLKRTGKNQANLGLAITISASPEFFYPDLKDEKNKKTWNENTNRNKEVKDLKVNFNKETTEIFLKRTQEWIEQEFGKQNLISLSIHYDEKTPHIQAIITPIIDGKLSAKEVFKPKNCIRWQVEFAEKVKDLGLNKGLNNDKKRKKHTEYNQEMIDKMAEELKIDRKQLTKDILNNIKYDNSLEKEKKEKIEQIKALHNLADSLTKDIEKKQKEHDSIIDQYNDLSNKVNKLKAIVNIQDIKKNQDFIKEMDLKHPEIEIKKEYKAFMGLDKIKNKNSGPSMN